MQLLALDTTTDTLSLAVRNAAGQVWQRSAPGGAQASARLIPLVLEMLAEAGLVLTELDAICFGSGPGSFTGLRTACSVAQGLAFGAGVPVLPVNSLLAVAETARALLPPGQDAGQIMALLDARMDEMYVATYAFSQGGPQGAVWTELQTAQLLRPEALSLPEAPTPAPVLLAGNVFAAYGARLPQLPAGSVQVDARPEALAMLRLAPALLAAGHAVAPALALPAYVRDKVAQTTAEREAQKLQKAGQQA
jgi:tRNA threonylcarbamoyladenosine biosynthesis protein TsaB